MVLTKQAYNNQNKYIKNPKIYTRGRDLRSFEILFESDDSD